jgi:hypothetical protein
MNWDRERMDEALTINRGVFVGIVNGPCLHEGPGESRLSSMAIARKHQNPVSDLQYRCVKKDEVCRLLRDCATNLFL